MSIDNRLSIAPDGTITVAQDANGDGVMEYARLATEADVNGVFSNLYLLSQYGTFGYVVPYFEAGNVSTGTTKYAWTCPYTFGAVILGAYASVGTAPASTSILVDINKNGTTIFTTQSNRVTIPAAATSGLAAAVQVTDLAQGDRITFDIDQVGTGTVGANLSVSLLISTFIQ